MERLRRQFSERLESFRRARTAHPRGYPSARPMDSREGSRPRRLQSAAARTTITLVAAQLTGPPASSKPRRSARSRR